MESNFFIIDGLLHQVAGLKNEYDKILEISGEKFNLFNILKVGTREVQTHSAFLCELLNPNGSHGYKAKFLNLFIANQKERFQKSVKFIQRFDQFQADTAKTILESHIGFIDDNYEQGGRIDILIKDKKQNAIIIENKIYARDQQKQLERYNEAYKSAPLFYLTLFGTKPSVKSRGRLMEDDNYVCISYKDDIVCWLEECRKETVNHPLLHESISMYIVLLKHLTNQTINDKMQEELVKIITKNARSIGAAFEIYKSIDCVKQSIIGKFKVSIVESFNQEELSIELKGPKFGLKDGELWFIPKGWSHAIILTFNANYEDLEIGIYRKDDKPCDDEIFKSKVRGSLKELNIGKELNYSNWVWNSKFSEWDDTQWWNKNDRRLSQNVKSTIDLIIQKLIEIDAQL